MYAASKNAFLVSLTLISLGMSYIWAQEIEVVSKGFGRTEEEALRDAKRNAIEEAFGTEIKSETIVQDFNVKKDQILAKAEGFVSYTEIKEKGWADGMYYIVITANVSRQKLEHEIEALKSLQEEFEHREVQVIVPNGVLKELEGPIDIATNYCRKMITSKLHDYLSYQGFNVTLREIASGAWVDNFRDHANIRPSERNIRSLISDRADFIVFCDLNIVKSEYDQREKDQYLDPTLIIKGYMRTTGDLLGEYELSGPRFGFSVKSHEMNDSGILQYICWREIKNRMIGDTKRPIIFKSLFERMKRSITGFDRHEKYIVFFRYYEDYQLQKIHEGLQRLRPKGIYYIKEIKSERDLTGYHISYKPPVNGSELPQIIYNMLSKMQDDEGQSYVNRSPRVDGNEITFTR